MPMLRTDDEARNIPSVWLGPPELVRWPFDASFSQWIIGFALLVPVWMTLSLYVPVVVWFGLFWWFFPKFTSQRFPEKFPAFVRSPWPYRTLLGILVVLIYAGNVKSFFLPMNFFAAIPFAIIGSFLIVRKVSKYITPMTPFLYWVKALAAILRRPRSPQHAEREFSVNSHVVVEVDDNFDLGDLGNPRPHISLVKEVR